jgi:RNA polymerase sigma factor (sigma-70 family)
MPTTPLRSALQAALSGTRPGLARESDAELLAAFAAGRDEAAFAELVRRHGRLVRGAARRLAGGPDAAEDVFQATFLLLARKAAAVAWGPTVGPWLYQAACRLAAKARARAARRRPHAPLGPEVAAPPSDPSAGLAWAEVRAALDEALAALPARLRDPLVLCYLEGLTQDEAAAALGCSPATVKGRVTRGRERLRRLLSRRGLSLSAALAGALVAGPAVSAGVATATAQAAAVFTATGAAPPAVRALLRGVPVGWSLAGLVGLVLACAAGALGLGGPPRQPDGPAPASAPAPQPVTDALGDPLPAGAVARLGTRRLYGGGEPKWLAFSPDGAKVVSQSHRGITVFDAVTGRRWVEREDYRVAAPTALGWRADGTGVAVITLPDQSLFVSAFTDPGEKRPNPPPPAPVAAHPRGPDVHHVALSPDATRLAVVRKPEAESFTIDLLPATPGRPVADLKPERTLGPFPGPCRAVRYAAGGLLVTLHGPWEENKDWSVAVIDPRRNTVVRTARIPPPGFCPWQYMLSLSPDARLAAVVPRTRIATNNQDGTVRVWDLAAGKEVRSVPFPQKGYGTGFAFTPDGARLITSTGEPYFQVWDLATGKEAFRARGPNETYWKQEAFSVAVSPDGKRFATGRRDCRIDVWDAATGEPVVRLATHRDWVEGAAVSPDCRRAATVGYDGAARVWELATGKPGAVIPAPTDPVPQSEFRHPRRPAFTPDGRGLLFRAAGKLALADPATGRLLDLPGGLRGRPENVGAFAADGKTLVTFSAATVTLWDWPAGTARLTVTVPLAPGTPGKPGDVIVRSASLSPDGRILFSNAVRRDPRGWYQNANDVWGARTGKHLHRLPTPEMEYFEYPPAAFSPDGRVMYLGGSGHDLPQRGRRWADALTAWDAAAGKLLRRFAATAQPPPARRGLPPRRHVPAVAVSPDGRLLAAVEGHVWLYEAAFGGFITKLAGHHGEVTDLAFTPDGRRLVSVSADQTGLVWDVTLPALGGARGGKFDEAWGLLAELDAGLAYSGMAALAASPTEAVRLLRRNLRPAPVPTDAELDRIVGQLGADAFAEREKASAELERFGPNAVAGAKARLGRSPAPEVRRRLRTFLERYDGPNPSPYQLRCARGVAVLEAMNTAEARALLAELAKGPADDPLTREARAAVRRAGERGA